MRMMKMKLSTSAVWDTGTSIPFGQNQGGLGYIKTDNRIIRLCMGKINGLLIA